MKRENNKKFKKRKRNQKRSLTCRVLSMMFAIVLFCSTVLINTDYVSQASSFDDMVDMVEVEEDSAAVDTSEDTGDDLDTDVNFESEESTDETYSESDDLGSSDVDFSSGENMFTDGTSESSAPAEEAAQPVSCIVNLKNETIEIKAEAPAGVLPNGTQMIVKAVENNTEDAELTDQYNKLAAKITEQLQSQGKNLDGFLAYNVSFTDADGNPVEPSDKVTYSFTYKEASSPELTDPAASTVTAAMIRTNKETSELELTELKAEEDKLTVETNESKQLTKAAFQSAATAAYTFVWSSTPAADDNENNENKEQNGEVNNEEVNADTNTENIEENGEETNTENNVENSEEEQNPEEAPDQEQIKMIRITADEVNLRVAPSTEADVIATVDTDAQLPLLETVTGEDEFTWYKVSYEEAEAYVRSDMAEVVETEEQGTENEDANEEEADVQVEDEVTYSQTIENVVVNATASKGVLPDDAQFVVTPIKSEDAQYEDIAARLEEKAENEEYSIAGFLAYDIYFLNSAGEKINPEDGKVKISMEYQNATAPEEVKESDAVQMDAEEDETSQENTEAKELSVSVMHFVEENGEVTSVVDMTKENSAAVETNEAGEVQKAEFETESFSTFTITWTQMKKSENGEISINVNYVDENGVDISEKVTNPIKIKASKGTAIKLEDYEPYISGYGFVKAQIGDATYNEDAATLKYIKATFGNTPNDSKVYEYSDDAQNWTTYDTEPTIYLVYTATGLSIKDELESTGDLVPELNDNLKNTITDKTVKYTWYKSINDGEFTEVNRIKVTGETYNIENKNGLDCLNVAMDEGTLSDTQTSVKYKVGLKIDDQEEIYSGEYNVRYYGELHNGGFETPVLSESAGSNWQFSNENYKAQGGVWQTTGTADNINIFHKFQDPDGADIEIVTAKANLSGYAWNGDACDARGTANTGQFAELNCQAAGALYQDVITYKGENLNFWLSHRARGVKKDSTSEYDTMYVVIMPTSKAKSYTTQASLVNLIDTYKDSTEGPVGTEYTEKGKKIICDDNNNDEGIFIERVTSDDQSWNSIKEEGQYLAKSSMTRFFFVAGATASGNNTQGNFLDEVNFGQKLPPADSGKFNLKIEKKFTGGFEPTSDLEDKMTFTIHALHQDGTEIDESEKVPLNGEKFKLIDMKKEDGSYSITLKDNEIGANTKYIYSVEETNAEVSAYDLVTTQTVSGGTVQSNKTSTLIGEKDSATFTITNKYTPIDINSVMEYNKTAKVDDWDKRTYDINITANSKLASSSTTIEKDAAADIMMVLDTSGSMLYYDNYHGYKEVKIFYGDTVPTDEDGDIVKALFDKAHPKGNVTQLDGTSKLVEYTMGANGEAINQQDFTLEWYRDPKCEEKDKITDWSQEKPTPGSTKYYLKVTYNAQGGKVTAHNSVTDQTRPYGVYTVNVIAGQIQITKELEEYPESTKEFKFEVTKEEDDTFKKELTISVDANSKVAEPQILDKLKRGTYHVREVLPEGSEYKVSSAEIGKATNCENVRPESSTYVATFKLGYKKDRKDENVITAEYTYDDKNPSGTIGAVKYTNTEIKANLDLMKTDEKQDKTYLDGAYFKLEKKSGENWVSVEKNYDKFVVSNKNGDIELKNLRNGEYRLTEVTAPTGYMLLSSPISFMVSNGTVTLNNEGTVSNMCELTPDPTNPPVLTIKNQKLYSLPESGGNGIYWYMIGGMVLMSTAAWILYKNKCREVLGK